MNRRYFLLTAGTSTLTVLTGCSGSKESVSRSTKTSKSEKSGTETKTRRSVKGAIETSRNQLTDALRTLNSTDVVKDSEIGITTSDNFEKYRNTDEEAVLGPVRETQSTLKAIRDRAEGKQAATVKVLLGISVYTEKKWKEYTAIVRAFTAFGVTLSKVADDNVRSAKKTAQDAENLLANVSLYHSKVTLTLQRIRKSSGEPGMKAWRPAQETSEQEALVRILAEMKPTFGGLREFLTGVTQSGRAVTLTENGKYSKALDFATSARPHMDTAMRHFQRALDRNVRYYTDVVTLFECQAREFYGVLATLVDAIEAYQDGNQTDGDELLSEYRSKLDRISNNCKGSTGSSK